MEDFDFEKNTRVSCFSWIFPTVRSRVLSSFSRSSSKSSNDFRFSDAQMYPYMVPRDSLCDVKDLDGFLSVISEESEEEFTRDIEFLRS